MTQTDYDYKPPAPLDALRRLGWAVYLGKSHTSWTKAGVSVIIQEGTVVIPDNYRVPLYDLSLMLQVKP